MNPIPIAALLLTVGSGLAGQPSPGRTVIRDACSEMIPASLKEVLASRFPRYRLPSVTDNSIEDVTYQKEKGGAGCLGVSTGDFDGNGTLDLAIVLSPRDSGDPVLVAALRESEHSNVWRTSLLRAFKEVTRGRIYVETLKPGDYHRTDAADGDLVDGERRHVSSRRMGIATGLIESTEIGYFFTGGRWVHVWIAN